MAYIYSNLMNLTLFYLVNGYFNYLFIFNLLLIKQFVHYF
jgi:hypothetical protein